MVKKKKRAIITIAVLAASYLLTLGVDIAHLGYTKANFWQHFYFMFFHGNIFHLAGNCLGAFYLVRDTRTLAIAYLASVALSFIAPAPFPVIGFSAPLLFMGGYYGRIFQRNPLKDHKLLIVYAFLIAGLFIPRISGLLHIVALFGGASLFSIKAYVSRLRYDYRKACPGK